MQYPRASGEGRGPGCASASRCGRRDALYTLLHTHLKGHSRTTMTDKWNMSQNLIAALLILFVVAERLEWNMIATLFIVLALAVLVKKVVYDLDYFGSDEFC